ncbi:unnamed protein product [Bursaphelenchus okinawaensis]|uniref:ANK_REP_REGION domain-containing protein n=1 Tax=Bursaphelenchus okinawaensis TaxID=465554 RepID=A0A811KIG4_9BILA|nr:unnamed protein product [Bursaphelenchus okinawaensis]CAG9103620.1 unnamed protein product [Bursaphelenchus okinawaensis]
MRVKLPFLINKHEKVEHLKKPKERENDVGVLKILRDNIRKYKPNEFQMGYEDGFSLFSAVITGHTECIEKHIKRNPQCLNKKNDKGWTPLMYSLAQGCSDGTSILLKAGADLTTLNNDRMTALGLGASYGHRSTLRNFLKHCRELKGAVGVMKMANTRDGNGRIPLHYAAENRQWEACEVLLHYGSNPNVRDNAGDTPMLLACASQNSPTIRAIFTKGGDPHIANNLGKTGYSVLHEKRKYLVEEGAKTKGRKV